MLRRFTALGLLFTAALFITGQTSAQDTGTERSYVRMFQFNPDGKTVVSYTFDGALLWWDLESRKLLRAQQAKVDDPIFDPRGNLLTIETAAEASI